jgi:HEAT repeat protein
VGLSGADEASVNEVNDMIWKRLGAIILITAIIAGCSRSTESLIDDIYSSNSATRRIAANQLMSKSNDPDATQKIINLLDDDDPLVVLIATQILGSRNDTTAVHPLGGLMNNELVAIRQYAAWSLGTIGYDGAMPYLVQALQDTVADVRYGGIVGLEHIHNTEALNYLYPMLRDTEDSLRARTINAIYTYRAGVDANVLASDFALPLTDRSILVRYVAVQALGGAWSDEVGWIYADSTVAGELLLQALDDPSKEVRIATITSLKYIRYEPAVPYLADMYDLSSVEEEVAIVETIEHITGKPFPPE